MFSKGKSKAETTVNKNLLNIIGAGTKVNGDLISDGDIRVDGIIEGHVTVTQRLVLSEQAVITGDIEAKDATIAGLLKGNIRVEQTLLLKASSRIEGDIITDKIIIESGAQFNGRCHMNSQISESVDSKNGNGQQKAKIQPE